MYSGFKRYSASSYKLGCFLSFEGKKLLSQVYKRLEEKNLIKVRQKHMSYMRNLRAKNFKSASWKI